MTTEPIRIGLFVIAFPRASETFIVTKVLKLLAHGFDVHVFALSPSGDWDAFDVLRGRDDVRARVHIAPPLGATPRSLARGTGTVMARALAHPSEFARLALHSWRHGRGSPLRAARMTYERSAFIGRELDILHVEFDYQGLDIADLKALFRCRLLLSARGTLQKSSTFGPDVPAYLFRHADGYHVISRALERNLRRLGLPASMPVWHIEPAIDLHLFQPPPTRARAPGEPLRILSVGRLTWEKGYEVALDTVALLRDRGVDFVYDIVGAGPYEEAVRYGIMHYNLASQVRMLGTRTREAMPDVYAQADVLLHAALSEGFCNAVIEAQAMELPVVTSDAGGLPENVEDGVTGYVVPVRNPAALADKLAVLARDSELRARLARAGRTRAIRRFDLDRQAEQFVRLYRELMALPQQ